MAVYHCPVCGRDTTTLVEMAQHLNKKRAGVPHGGKVGGYIRVTVDINLDYDHIGRT